MLLKGRNAGRQCTDDKAKNYLLREVSVNERDYCKKRSSVCLAHVSLPSNPASLEDEPRKDLSLFIGPPLGGAHSMLKFAITFS